MDDKWEPPKMRQTYAFRYGYIFCQNCLKSWERRYLKREKFEKILDIEKFWNYAKEWEKKNYKINTIKNQVSWELMKNDNIWAHKQCRGPFFKMIILINKSIVPIFKMIKLSKFIVKLQTHLKQPKFQLNVKVPEKI